MPNINDLFNQAAQDNQNILSRSDVKYASPDFEQYRFQDNYNNIGFNPFDPAQHKRWEAQETTWTALAKGWDTFKGRFGNTFTDYWADYGRMAEAAFTFDLRKLAPDDADLLRQYNKDQKELMKNYVFAPMGTEDDIFTKKTVSEFIGNAGFALGTFAGMAIELGVDAIITVATEGAGAESFAFTAARIGAKQAGKQAIKGMAKTGARDLARGMVTVDRAVETAADAGKVAKQIEQIKQVSNIRKFGNAYKQTADEMFKTISFNMKGIIKSKSFGQFFENVAKGFPLLGTGIRYGEHIAKASKAGASSFYKIGLGIQGVRRIASELNMSSTESGFEAASTYGETLDQMIAQHRIDKGTNPTAFELEQMKTFASKAAYSNFKTNLPILLATNRLQFGSIFNKFPIANKWVNEIAGADTEKFLGVNRLFKSSSRIAKGYVKGVTGTWGLLGQVSKDFGKKQAMLLGLKTFGKSVFKFELNEGLQENLQETSAIGWRNYYAGQFNGIQYTLEEAFTKGAEAQLTKQGLKTFLMGAFTGMLIHGPTAAMTGSIEGVQRGITNYKYRNDKENNPYTKAREQQKKDINALNEFFDAIAKDKNLGKLLHFAYQTEKVQEQTQAAANNDQYTFQNAEDDVVLHMAILADKLGMSKAYQTAIREMGSEMTDKEFEEAFGVKLEETKYKSAREFTEKAVKDIKKYTEAVESIRQSASNLINPYLFEGDEQEMAMIMRNAQEDAIHILALNYLKSSRAVERAKSLAHELSQIPEIANSTDYVFRVMKNPEHINSEIGSLVVEIKNLEKSLEGVDAETKAQIEEQINTKKQLVELLHKWKGYYPSKKEKVIVQEEGKESETEQTIYGRFAGKKTQVTNEENKVVDTYDPYDREVFETYRKIVNLKNKEYGYDVTIPDTGLDNAFKKVIDFIQLDRDAKDYMEAYNQIFNPEMYMNLVINMSSGKLKYYVITMLDMINNDIRNLIENTIIYSNETILKGIIEGTLTVKQVSDKVKEIYEETRTKIESLESFKILLVASSTLDWGSQKNVEMYYNTLKTLQNELEPILEEVEAYCKSPNIFDSKEQTDDEKLEALGYSNEDIRIISPEDKENIIKNHIGRETYFAKEEEEEAATQSETTQSNPVQGVPIKSFVRSGENIGSQGINENKLFALAQNIAKELGIDINESNYIAKLKPHLDKVIAFVREHPAHVQRAVNGMYDIEDGNHRANLLRLLGATHIPAIIAQPSAPEEQEPKTFITNGNDVETTSGKTVVTTNSPEEATQLSFDFNQTTLTYDMVVAQYPELTVEQAIKFSEFIDAELKKYNEKYKSKTLKAFFKLKSEKLYKTWSKAQEVNIDETPEEITPEETPEIVYPVDQVEPNSNQKLNSQDIKSFTDKLINFNKSFEMPETNTTFVVKAETDALSKLNSISSCKK
jgi:hypothetical protein